MSSDELPVLAEDTPGQSPPEVSGNREAAFFDKNAALHKHAMRKLELGWIGRIIGDSSSTPTHIAFLALVAGLLLCFISLEVARAASGDGAEFWHSFAERSLAFGATALAFIFGKSSSK